MNWLEERDVNTNTVAVPKWIIGLFCISICCLLSVGVSASVPGLISYQGQLNDGSGAPVNGTVAMTFSIYSAPSGGTALWTENQTIPVSNGVFSVQLGTDKALPASVFENDLLFLGVSVGADKEMTPRQQLTSAAYSQRAGLGVPIGTIQAWAKSMPGVPELPAVWVECNGQVLNDPESPLNGVTIPDLNNNSAALKGATSSGGTSQEDYLPSHTHSVYQYPLYGGIQSGNCGSIGCSWHNNYLQATQSGSPQNYFHVVWIMKVKN